MYDVRCTMSHPVRNITSEKMDEGQWTMDDERWTMSHPVRNITSEKMDEGQWTMDDEPSGS